MENNDIIQEPQCLELKNIQYKTMLLNGKPFIETSFTDDLSNLTKFLETEKTNNDCEPWTKLNKTMKLQKLEEFQESFSLSNSLDKDESTLLQQFLKDAIDRKKLSKVKEVIYDKEVGTIKQIPGLVYNKATRHFTIKNVDKRVSTSKSLPPKKKTTTRNN